MPTPTNLLELAAQSAVEPKVDERRDYLKSFGVDDTTINTMNTYTPGDAYLDVFNKTTPKPTEYDYAKAKKNQTMAALAQGLGTLAEMYSASKGAHIKQRNVKSPQEVVAANERQLENVYQRRMDQYNQGMQSASLRDAMSRQQHEQNKITRAQGLSDRFEAEGREEKKYQRRREESNEDWRNRNETSIKTAEAKAKITNQYRTPKTAKTPKRVVSAEEKVDIRTAFNNLPMDYLRKIGAVKTRMVDNPNGLDLKVKEEYIDDKIDIEEMEVYVNRYGTQSTTKAPKTSNAGIAPVLTQGKKKTLNW